MWAWQQAKLSGAVKDVLKSFAQCAKAVRVRFEYLPDEHDFERRKFLLRQESKDAEKTEVLNGWNLICAVNDVRVLCRRSGLLVTGTADEAALEAWWLRCPSKCFFKYVRIHVCAILGWEISRPGICLAAPLGFAMLFARLAPTLPPPCCLPACLLLSVFACC